MKKIKLLIVLLLVAISVTGCDNNNIHHIEMNIKDYGIIKLDLDEDIAPVTVKNFIGLVNEGFYDGLSFHRVIEGFMIQGGSPTHDSNGGLNNKIKGEFKQNGFDNTLSHKRGVISMARAQDFNSASCQFFIVQKDSTFLDGSYAAFGYVTEGMEIVDKIVENTKVEDDNGTVLVENQPVIEYIKEID